MFLNRRNKTKGRAERFGRRPSIQGGVLRERRRRLQRRARANKRSATIKQRSEDKRKPKPSELKVRKQIRQKQQLAIWAVLWLCFTGALVFALYHTSRLESVTVRTIAVAGVQSVPERSVEREVRRSLTGSVLGVFPRDNTLLVPRRDIEKVLEEEFLRIRSATITRDGATNLLVSVQERFPVFVVCRGGESLCLLGDDTGLLFAATSYTTPEARDLPLFTSSQNSTRIGSYFLTQEDINALILLEQNLEEQGIEVEAIDIFNDTDARLITEEEYDILVEISDDHTDAFYNLLSALDSDLLKEKVAEKNIYEIDLRFGNKVYYRFE